MIHSAQEVIDWPALSINWEDGAVLCYSLLFPYHNTQHLPSPAWLMQMLWNPHLKKSIFTFVGHLLIRLWFNPLRIYLCREYQQAFFSFYNYDQFYSWIIGYSKMSLSSYNRRQHKGGDQVVTVVPTVWYHCWGNNLITITSSFYMYYKAEWHIENEIWILWHYSP